MAAAIASFAVFTLTVALPTETSASTTPATPRTARLTASTQATQPMLGRSRVREAALGFPAPSSQPGDQGHGSGRERHGDGEGSAIDIHLPHPRVDARRRHRRAPQEHPRVERAREEEGPGGPEDGIEAGATDGKHVQGELDDAATGRQERQERPPARAVRSVE